MKAKKILERKKRKELLKRFTRTTLINCKQANGNINTKQKIEEFLQTAQLHTTYV